MYLHYHMTLYTCSNTLAHVGTHLRPLAVFRILLSAQNNDKEEEGEEEL